MAYIFVNKEREVIVAISGEIRPLAIIVCFHH